MINHRLLTATLAVLLAGGALAGAALAQGPVETACGATIGNLDEEACADLAGNPVDAALADLTVCTEGDPADAPACIVAFALANAPAADPDDVCAELGTIQTTFPECVSEFIGTAVPFDEAHGAVCEALGFEDGTADGCATSAVDGAVADLGAAVAPQIGALDISDSTPEVGQLVTIEGSFTTFLSRLPGPLAGLSTASGNPVNDTVAALDDVEAQILGFSGAAITVDNAAHTFEATFSTSAAGTFDLTIVLTYAEPLGQLATTSLAPLVTDESAFQLVASQSNRAPLADAGDDRVVLENVQVTLDGSGSSDPDGDTLLYAWSQVGGPAVNLTQADGSSPTATFNAPDVSAPTDLTFRLGVTDGPNEASDTVVIQVSQDGGGSSANVRIRDSDAVLGLVTSAFAGPAAGTASDTELKAFVRDPNGVDELDNGLLSASLTGPQLSATALSFADFADSATVHGSDDRRDYRFPLAFGDRLQDGAYQFAATYDGSDAATFGFTVANVAPTLDAGSLVTQTFTAGLGAITTDPVVLTLDDVNWGGFGGASVVELKDLTLSGVPSNLVFQVSADGVTWADASQAASLTHSLSEAASPGPLDLHVRLASVDGQVAEGQAVVKAVLSDQGGLSSPEVTLFTLTILPENHGFFFGVDDGGDGITLGDGEELEPGARTTSALDPVRVSFTGTYAADALVITIGEFTCELPCDDSFSAYDSDPQYNGKVLVYGESDLSDAPLVSVVDATGAAAFDLSASLLGAAGSTIYVVLDIYVPGGLDEGAYTGIVDVQATGDDA